MTIEPWGAATARRYHPSPLIDSAGGRGLALYRFMAIVYAGVLVVVHREHVILWWPIIAYGVLALAWSIIAPLLRRPTVLAIGINRIVVTDGHISATAAFKSDYFPLD